MTRVRERSRFFKLENFMSSQNPYFCSVTQTSGCHLTNLASTIIHISLYVWQKARSQHRWHQWTLDAGWTQRGILFSKIGLATKTDRAIDLSCRACGAGAWALGLDSRLGTPASLPFSPPTSDVSFFPKNDAGVKGSSRLIERRGAWGFCTRPLPSRCRASFLSHV